MDKIIIKNSRLKCPECGSRNINQMLNLHYIHCIHCGTTFTIRKDKSITQILSELDWKLILKNAIENRPSSWADKPVVEWRNAGDTIFCALMQELRKRRYVK